MIIKGIADGEEDGRTYYPLDGFSIKTEHFVVRETTPSNPFAPHEHEKRELWYIVEGTGFVTLGSSERVVSAGDLIRLDPWVRHGLRTEGRLRWICLG